MNGLSGNRLWNFLLVNNAIVLSLFVYAMIEKDQLVIGSIGNWRSWHINFSSSDPLIGIFPFLLSFIYLIWKIAQLRRKGKSQALDEQDDTLHH